MSNHTRVRRLLRLANQTGTCPVCAAEAVSHEHESVSFRTMAHQRDCDVIRVAPTYETPRRRTRREAEDGLARIESQVHHCLVDV